MSRAVSLGAALSVGAVRCCTTTIDQIRPYLKLPTQIDVRDYVKWTPDRSNTRAIALAHVRGALTARRTRSQRRPLGGIARSTGDASTRSARPSRPSDVARARRARDRRITRRRRRRDASARRRVELDRTSAGRRTRRARRGARAQGSAGAWARHYCAKLAHARLLKFLKNPSPELMRKPQMQQF
jgi:hypothetical protein